MKYFCKTAVWNANGLSQHIREVEIHLKEHKMDFFVSKTHFTSRSFVRLPNYSIYSTNYPDNTAHGRSVLVIQNNIKRYLYSEFKTPHIKATSVCIPEWNVDLTIWSINCPPRHNNLKEHLSPWKVYIQFKLQYSNIVCVDIIAQNKNFPLTGGTFCSYFGKI